MKISNFREFRQSLRMDKLISSKIWKDVKPGYNYEKGPNDPTYISGERAMYIYGLTQKELGVLRKVRLRSAHNFDKNHMICYLEKDVERLCREKGNTPKPTENSCVGSCQPPLSEINVSKNNFKVLGVAISSNVVILFAKFSTFLYTGSTSILCFNLIVLMIGSYYSSKEPAQEHPYGWTRARHISSLISSVTAFSVGTTISVTEGFYALKHGSELDSLNLALSVLGLSFVAESCSLIVVVKNIVKMYTTREHSNIFSTNFLHYLRTFADPINMAILMEDVVAILGVSIAFVCILTSRYYKSSVPDSIGSISIGVLLGISAFLLTKRNINFLLERSIDRSKLEAIIDFIEGDKIVRSVHDVKATMMGSGRVKFKAEINYDGPELAKAYLRSRDVHELLTDIRRIKTKKQLKNFTINHTTKVMDCLGRENDRLEQKIMKKFPELRHIDLETL
ncbi:Zinc transporter 9 [Thelohanellus kitauei]|uniref:Zinc transporter 9 n=1 Tax=Thelohanellus kitauei TaxID=669202 RepID=A0A0C2IV62_THEKT|nr:Zinc transporter 9 [Thelohanellus kitauei]